MEVKLKDKEIEMNNMRAEFELKYITREYEYKVMEANKKYEQLVKSIHEGNLPKT